LNQEKEKLKEMINSKGIKILCKVIMGIVYVLCGFSIVAGISSLVDDEKIGILYIVLGILLPLITTVSLYPIFALANIDENIQSLNSKIESLFVTSQKIDFPSYEEAEAPYVECENETEADNTTAREKRDANVVNNKTTQESREKNGANTLIDIVGIPDLDNAFDALNELYQKGYIGKPWYDNSKVYDSDGVHVWHCECHLEGMERFVEGDFYSKEYGKEVTAYQMALSVLGLGEEDQDR
jgi:uncharacterized membrane protein required for colicin V production